ncbi:magnesium transporter CorA family protein [Staphylococcus hyicus]|uniref:magnesium transporter CorA family protein n=1 Tax=Staphylococcus hyicus TaxID=1284 RepID=UPI0036D30E76
MITAYRNNENLAIIETSDWSTAQWINVVKPTQEESQTLLEFFPFPKDFLEDALDSEESSRIENDESGYSLIISDFPVLKDDHYDIKSYHTSPLGIIIGKGVIITICSQSSNYFDHLLYQHVNLKYKSRFALNVLYEMSSEFNRALRLLNKERRQVDIKLQKRVTNLRLYFLSEIEKSLVYFIASLKTNASTHRKLYRLSTLKRFSEDDELLEDVLNEHQQAIETTELYLRIVESMTNSYASLLSNQLNTTMQTLTIFTVLLTLPTLVFSFFGMNVPLPIDAQSGISWIIVIAISLILVVLTSILLWHSNRLK